MCGLETGYVVWRQDMLCGDMICGVETGYVVWRHDMWSWNMVYVFWISKMSSGYRI